MRTELSSNAQAILLLTAPLIAGRSKASADPLSAGEYRRFARRLRELRHQPADLLDPGAREVLKECRFDLDSGRLDRLLGRGFLLSQAMERWRTRAIWVVSRADAAYPQRFKKRLGENAPPILYGCGDAAILATGGLAVVGSRNVSDTLIDYTEEVGRLTAAAQRTLVSGGARGIDQAAMRGALEAGGHVMGVLADSLDKAVMRREHRKALIDGRLALITSYDPAARFIVGHAMQRNKLIYALADSALVVSSDYEKGGTWAGAVEQLDKLKFLPIYIRAEGERGKGLDELRKRGAIPWPDPKTPGNLQEILDAPPSVEYSAPELWTLSPGVRDESAPFEDERQAERTESVMTPGPRVAAKSTLAGELFCKVRELLDTMDGPKTEAEVAEELQVSKKQAETWLERFVDEKLRERLECTDEPRTEAELAEMLRVPKNQIRRCLKRLIEEGAIEKLSRPVRYHSTVSVVPLFGHDN